MSPAVHMRSEVQAAPSGLRLTHHVGGRFRPATASASAVRASPPPPSYGASWAHFGLAAARQRAWRLCAGAAFRRQRRLLLHVAVALSSDRSHADSADLLPGPEAVSSSLDAVSLTDDPRFLGVQRLYGDAALQRLRAAHVCVVGVGGVGSWAAEALARCGVGQLTLVDLDEVCITNVNRQIHALQHTVGQSKCAVMRERIVGINPSCHVQVIEDFLTAESAEGILSRGYDMVLDAVDFADHKAELIAYCCANRLPVVSTGGTGGSDNPLAIKMDDITDVQHNKLLAATRKRLRKSKGFPAGVPNNSKAAVGHLKWKVPCVYIAENVQPNWPSCFAPPRTLSAAASPPPTTVCAVDDASGATGRLSCANGTGSAVFVTGGVGFFAASYIVAQLAQAPRAELAARA